MFRFARLVAIGVLIAQLAAPVAPSRVVHASGAKALATLSVLAAPVMVGSPSGASAAVDGQSVELGDQVWTGADGLALLTFFDGSETQLEGGTQIVLEAPPVDPNAQTGSGVSVFVTSGTTVTHVQHLAPGSTFQTDTPSAVAMVRGTTYVVSVAPLEVVAAQPDDEAAMSGTDQPGPSDAATTTDSATNASPSTEGAAVTDAGDDDQHAAGFASHPLQAFTPSFEAPVEGCRRDDPNACVTSVVLLADADGHVGHVEVAPHGAGGQPSLQLTSHGAAAHVTQLGATPQQLAPRHIAQLHQAAGNLHDVARAFAAQHAAKDVLRVGLPPVLRVATTAAERPNASPPPGAAPPPASAGTPSPPPGQIHPPATPPSPRRNPAGLPSSDADPNPSGKRDGHHHHLRSAPEDSAAMAGSPPPPPPPINGSTPPPPQASAPPPPPATTAPAPNPSAPAGALPRNAPPPPTHP